ncbi:MAG: hypothetical protein ABL919_07305 [Methylococcales bacterium]|nr:hypothetical protein [Methylococcaceae bacterium]
MNELTLGEMMARKDALENEAAKLLGHMLFEFSRLDMNLGLCLVWVDGGTKLESLTKTVSDQCMSAKLVELSKHVDAKLPTGSNRHKAYQAWLARTNKVRQQRNELVHGRWGIDPYNNTVINVLGLPTLEAQRSVEYTVDELAAINDELRSLQRELSKLREQWPL